MREELTLLRGRDEVAELEEEAEEARAQRLCLSALYAKPPPVWLHPAFAAEFGDVRASTSNRSGPARGRPRACTPRMQPLR